MNRPVENLTKIAEKNKTKSGNKTSYLLVGPKDNLSTTEGLYCVYIYLAISLDNVNHEGYHLCDKQKLSFMNTSRRVDAHESMRCVGYVVIYKLRDFLFFPMSHQQKIKHGWSF